MNRDDIQKLLGGYATGTLTEAERKALFDAALQDQKLFDALADEEAFRQVLRDPAAKAELLRTLEPAPRPFLWTSWLRRPMGWAALGSLAAGVALVVLLVQSNAPHNNSQLAVFRDELSRPPSLMTQAKPKTSESKPATPRAESATRQIRRARSPEQPESALAVEPQAAPAPPRASSAADAGVPKQESPVPKVLNFAPTDPMSAVAAFQQTAPRLSADAAEVRSEKARSGIGLTALRQQAAVNVPASTVASGVRYEIQQRSESGMYQGVDPDLPLRGSTPLRLEAETNKAGYLYAFETGLDELYRQLAIGPTVDPHVKHTVELGEPAAGRKLLLVFSIRPQAAFTVGATTEGAARELNRLRAESSAIVLLRQKSGNSVYVVGPASPVLLIEVNLPAAQ